MVIKSRGLELGGYKESKTAAHIAGGRLHIILIPFLNF